MLIIHLHPAPTLGTTGVVYLLPVLRPHGANKETSFLLTNRTNEDIATDGTNKVAGCGLDKSGSG